jgi:hypothetical protein
MNPKMSRAHAAIGDALLMLGRTSEARAAYALEPAKDVSLTGLAIVEWKLGNAKAARDAMTKLVADLASGCSTSRVRFSPNGAKKMPRSRNSSGRTSWAIPG